MAELAVVLCVIGILMAVGVPGFVQLRDLHRVRAASFQLGASLAGARILAVSQGTPISVCAAGPDGRCRQDGVWDAGWMVFRNPARAQQPVDAADIIELVDPPTGVRIRGSAARSQARFLPDGRSAGTNLTLRVCSGGARASGARLIVSNAGRLRTERLPEGHPECADP